MTQPLEPAAASGQRWGGSPRCLAVGLALGVLVVAGGSTVRPPAPAAAAPSPAPISSAVAPAPPVPAPPPPAVARAIVPAEVLAELPEATTLASLPAAPRDDRSQGGTDGLVVRPETASPLYTSPGGSAFAVLPVAQLGEPTAVPVVARQPGWIEVLLPSRPNHATGWLWSAGGGLQLSTSPYLIQVDTAARRLTITNGGQLVGSWPVAVGAAGTPTPVGRTFLLADVSEKPSVYGPLIGALGTHSDVLETFGGGPGTVALHGWPSDPSVFGRAVSHGCVRAPAAGMQAVGQLPLGTVVLIS